MVLFYFIIDTNFIATYFWQLIALNLSVESPFLCESGSAVHLITKLKNKCRADQTAIGRVFYNFGPYFGEPELTFIRYYKSPYTTAK